ncbi:GFA family protein [Sideroxydans sp. CL21]|uniref:GFA family protein n=1 Tax=Sideroxydans sp. CL21 TaxID=2600596 RepID=UPI0024BC2D76|nr:GFA family protein [Sideroxydans sp. CL21]
MSMQPYKGSCHCGAIRFSFEAGPFTHGTRCNCSFCAKRGAMVHPVPGAQFQIEAQDGALGMYQWGTKTAKHYFCRNCGVATFSETARWPGQYMVNLGCVEGVDTLALETKVFDGKHLL